MAKSNLNENFKISGNYFSDFNCPAQKISFWTENRQSVGETNREEISLYGKEIDAFVAFDDHIRL